MQETTAQEQQKEEVPKIGFSENAGGVPEGWRELAEANSRSLDEMMKFLNAGRVFKCTVREITPSTAVRG